MPEAPRMTAESRRVVVPFHSGVTLHPKTIKEVLDAIEEVAVDPSH